MQISSRDLHGVLIERDVADEVLDERRMGSSGADAYGHREPVAALHRVGRNDFRRMFCIVIGVDPAELGRELLVLAVGSIYRRYIQSKKHEKRGPKRYGRN